MALTVQIAARLSRPLKRKVANEVRFRRRRGEGLKDADIVREALAEYFERRANGKAAA
jgi:hypothetical protein